MTNKSAQELYSEYKSLQKQVDGLDKRITKRLLFLSKKHPEAIVDNIGEVEVKAISITYFSEVVETYPVKTRINYIAAIETWLKNQNPYKQLSLFDNL